MTAANIIRRDAQFVETGSGILRLLRGVRESKVLVVELARRELTDLHSGQSGGFVWLVLHPVLMFLVYTFLFTAVLKVRIGSNGPGDYTVYLFSGLAPWLLTQDAIQRSAGVMIANVGIVKKVLFPVEAIVAKSLLASMMVQIVFVILAILTTVWIRGTIPAAFAMLLILVPIHLALLWGISLLLSAITPFFRDTVEFVRVFISVNMFLMPVIYLPDMVPGVLKYALVLNPFSHLVWCYQDVLYFNAINHPWSWVVTTAFAASMLAAGSYVFLRLRHQFSSVL
jgi:lipopolysaccharide transport system permease protein